MSPYSQRRLRLNELTHCPVVIAANAALQLSGDTPVSFMQDANFLYLTGINEAGWQLIIEQNGMTTLIAPNISEIHRIFDGALSNDNAKKISGVDKVVEQEEGKLLLDSLLDRENTVGVLGPDPHEEHFSFTVNPAPQQLYEEVKANVKEVIDIRSVLAKLRGIKDTAEIEAIRQAVKTTCLAFEKVKESLKTAQYEYNLEAEFTYLFRNQGLKHAYEPIVAADKNACTLHYIQNDVQLPKNGLVLMDVGARFNDYAADITRTYAIGTPTDRQVAVHGAVEKAHHEIIALLKPGLSVKEYHEKVDEVLKAALKSLGLLGEPENYRTYFPHAISHGLGLDVHDPLGMPKEFEPGMVLTVEPGIYIPEEGIGVRIEDDILITKDGHENLSGHLSTSL